MYQDLSSRNESKIRELSNQVHQLEARLLDYKAQLDLKDNQIHQLNYENLQLKVQLKKIAEQQTQTQTYNQSSTSTTNIYTSQATATSNQYKSQVMTPNQHVNQVHPYSASHAVNKRQCPICGAIGPSIKEYEDKTRIISYIPRRIYATKYVCIKCRHEF